jgi:glucose-1-phosphatase
MKNKTSNMKNIIFDLGNVIIDLDLERTWFHLKHWLGDDYESILKQIHPNTDIFIQFEIGKISEEDFFDTLRATTDTPLSIRQLKEAWNAMLLQIPPQRFEMLSRLKERYNVFLLSNTNETHLHWVDGYLQTVHGFSINDFDERYFHKPYYSHLIHLRKPNTDIYEYVLADAGIKAEESLFIDDNFQNIEGAKKVGLQTYLHPVGVEIADVLNELTKPLEDA